MPLFAPISGSAVSLSPDGCRLAYLDLSGPQPTVQILNLGEPSGKVAVFSGVVSTRREDFQWSARNELLFLARSSRAEQAVYIVDARGAIARVLVRETDLPPQYAPDPDSKNLVINEARVDLSRSPLAPKPTVRPRTLRVIGFSPKDPTGLLVVAEGANPGRAGPDQVETSTYCIDLATGAKRLIDEVFFDGRALYDDRGRVRLLETPRTIRGGSAGTGRVILDTDRPMASRLTQEVSPALTAPAVFHVRQEFQFRTANGRWQDLDKVPGLKTPLRFTFSDDDFYRARSFPLALGSGGDVVYFASNVGSDTFGIYVLDLASGRSWPLVADAGPLDLAGPGDALFSRALVFDRQYHVVGVRMPGFASTTRWLDARLAALQQQAEARFPERMVQLEQWTDDMSRVLLRVYGAKEPGRWFVFQPGPPVRWFEVLRPVAALKAGQLVDSTPFEFTTTAGVRLLGRFTPTMAPRVTPPPLVVRCRDIPGPGVIIGGYDPEAQALAAQGYAVLDVLHRGSAGLGLTHRDAALRDLDRIPVEDIRAAMAWVRGRHPFDARRVALLGRGVGGYVALRALEQYPDEFRCAVMINAPVDINDWLLNPADRKIGLGLADIEIRREFFAAAKNRTAHVLGDLRQRPVLIAHERFPVFAADDNVAAARDLFRKQGRDFMVVRANGAGAAAKAKYYHEIGQFLNASVFDYKVQVGKERVVE